MATATKSRDGRKRFTLKVSHRVGRKALAGALAVEIFYSQSPGGQSPGEAGHPNQYEWPTSRREALSMVRDFLEDRGYHGLQCPYESVPQWPEERPDQWERYALGVVDDLFGEFEEEKYGI